MRIFVIDTRRFEAPGADEISPFRLEKAARFRRAEDRLLSLAASKALDAALSEYGFSERDMRYKEERRGKPAFADCPLEFSLSHSGHYACAAVHKSPVGIDVQMTIPCDMRIAARCFSEAERAYIGASASPDSEFTRIWTLRESAVKLTGEGISAMQGADLSRLCTRTFALEGAFLSAAVYDAEDAEPVML